jgi:hypothetical protein
MEDLMRALTDIRTTTLSAGVVVTAYSCGAIVRVTALG